MCEETACLCSRVEDQVQSLFEYGSFGQANASTIGELGTAVYETFNSPWQDSGLTSGSTYYYTLRTVDMDGNENADTTRSSFQ